MTNNYVQFGETFEFEGAQYVLTIHNDPWDVVRKSECSIHGHDTDCPFLWGPKGELVNKDWSIGEDNRLMRCIRREGEFAPKSEGPDDLDGALDHRTFPDRYPTVDPAELELIEEKAGDLALERCARIEQTHAALQAHRGIGGRTVSVTLETLSGELYCDCCGDICGVPPMYDGDPLLCGCAGCIRVDERDDTAECAIDDELECSIGAFCKMDNPPLVLRRAALKDVPKGTVFLCGNGRTWRKGDEVAGAMGGTYWAEQIGAEAAHKSSFVGTTKFRIVEATRG